MKGLKGLLINNAYLVRENAKIPLVVGVVALTARIFHHVGIIDFPVIETLFASTTLALFPGNNLEAVGRAMNANWDSFMKAMPVSKSMIVVSHYAMFILLSAICLVVWLALPFDDGNAATVMRFLVLIHVLCIVYYPVVYLLRIVAPDAEGHFTMAIAIGAGAAGAIAFGAIATERNAIPLGLGIIAAGHALSIALSVYLDKLSRQGRAKRKEHGATKKAPQLLDVMR